MLDLYDRITDRDGEKHAAVLAAGKAELSLVEDSSRAHSYEAELASTALNLKMQLVRLRQVKEKKMLLHLAQELQAKKWTFKTS